MHHMMGAVRFVMVAPQQNVKAQLERSLRQQAIGLVGNAASKFSGHASLTLPARCVLVFKSMG